MSEKIFEIIENFKLPIALSLVGIVLIIGGVFASNLPSNQAKSAKMEDYPKESLVSLKQISVDVSGAVKNPGVYKLDTGARIEEAIKIAGGFSDQANQEFISKHLNLAQKLVDGSKVYIPVIGETTTQVNFTSDVAGVNSQTKININTATQSELESLPGIGPVTASKIISDRPYQSVEQLLEKKILGKAVYDKIKDSLSLY